MNDEVSIRILNMSQDFSKVKQLQQLIWQRRIEDTISIYIMHSVSHNGGAVIGAERDNNLVGFAFCFVAERADDVTIWSHISGVHPDYQGYGIGKKLKFFQRTWAMERGHRKIAWTFDPLQRGNANFNFNHLGALGIKYHVDYYGNMDDIINEGLATDRLEAVWNLYDPKVMTIVDGNLLETRQDNFHNSDFLLQNHDGTLYQKSISTLTKSTYCIEIPYNITQLKKANIAQAISWQLAIRNMMLRTFSHGYYISGFVKENSICWYVVSKKNDFI